MPRRACEAECAKRFSSRLPGCALSHKDRVDASHGGGGMDTDLYDEFGNFIGGLDDDAAEVSVR